MQCQLIIFEDELDIEFMIKLLNSRRMLQLSHCGKNLQENPETVNRNQLNASKAKMQYTFEHSERFKTDKNTSASSGKFYNLPDLWTKKGASIGFGNKIDLAKQYIKTPAPGDYNLKSSFEKKSAEGITIGYGRDVIKHKNVFATASVQSPDFATYYPLKPSKTRAYSIGQKLETGDNKWAKSVPGPGNYSLLELTNGKCNKMISKYCTPLGGKFGKQQRGSLASKSIAPGPGIHEIYSRDFGYSSYEKPYATRFGSSVRTSVEQKTIVPGPGSYEAFSEFLR